MFKKATFALGLGLAAATPALAVDEPFPVSGVQVSADLDGVSVSDVANFYPEFNADLEKAIWAEMDNPETDGGPGFEIDVKVTSVTLDGNPLGINGQFNELDGIVTYTYAGADQPSGTYPIEVRATAGDVPAGALVVAPSEADYYAAMLGAFANGVEDKLGELPDPMPESTINN